MQRCTHVFYFVLMPCNLCQKSSACAYNRYSNDHEFLNGRIHPFKILCCNMKPCAVQQMKYENWTPVLCGSEQFPVCPATGCLVSSAHFGKSIQIFKLCCIRGTIPVSRNGCVLGQPSGCLYIVSAFKK